MSQLDWQKSSFSSEGNNCLNIATTPDGTLRLRESDRPDTVIRTTPAGLEALLRSAKAGQLDGATG